MSSWYDFFTFADPNVRYVAFGSVLLAATAAVVGCFSVLRKRALVGDAVAHAVLPGVCLAFIFSETKNPFILLIGAFITGWLSLVAIDFISGRSRIKTDTSLALVLSVFFGVGILLLTAIQQSGNASQSGLDKFLFGSAASLLGPDLLAFGAVAVLLLLSTVLFFKEFALLSFDEAFAQSIGYNVRALELLLTTLTVMAVVVGIQAVGVVLMSAMLITPAAAARFWTDRLLVMILVAAGIGAFSGLAGAFVSYTAPAMPTGPWIVLIVSGLAVLSFAFAPHRGMWSRYRRQKDNRRQILEENLLKALYHLGEGQQDFYTSRTVGQIQDHRQFPAREVRRGLKRLRRKGLITFEANHWTLTPEGQEGGRQVVRRHRLWELYLNRYLHLDSDHVHEAAETIEHILTPELEEKLHQDLGYPLHDPHDEKIP